MRFTERSTLREINTDPMLSQAKDRLISGGDFFSGKNGGMTLAKLQEKNPTWYTGDILYGLERLCRVAAGGGQYVYPVYPVGEIEKNPRLAAVQFFYLPAAEKTNRSFALLLAGGAYGAVCTMVEAMPVAARLNELGVTCFCLNYRTATPKSFLRGLLPSPLDDVAAALRFIQENAAVFEIDADDYFVGGFSAGGHLASLWGTAHLGARNYGLPQPQMLMLAYPLITLENLPNGPMKQMMCTGLFGPGNTRDDIRRYSAAGHVDSAYPKTYLARCEDDSTVPPKDGNDFLTALEVVHIPNRLEQAETGGHGFGLGSATPLAGWVERAVSFMEEGR